MHALPNAKSEVIVVDFVPPTILRNKFLSLYQFISMSFVRALDCLSQWRAKWAAFNLTLLLSPAHLLKGELRKKNLVECVELSSQMIWKAQTILKAETTKTYNNLSFMKWKSAQGGAVEKQWHLFSSLFFPSWAQEWFAKLHLTRQKLP